MWKVTLYAKTKMNTANTVANGLILNQAGKITELPAIDVLQAEGIDSVTVKGTREQVIDAEYLKLTDLDATTAELQNVYYYQVTDIPQASSVDVWRIPVIIDALLTLSARYQEGIKGIRFTDGIIERHHIKPSDDRFGRYTEDDPYLVPSEPLELHKENIFTDECSSSKVYSFVESTINLATQDDLTQATTYYNNIDEGLNVTVPRVFPELNPSKFAGLDTATLQKNSGGSYWRTDDYAVSEGTKSGIEKCRALGIENAIVASWAVPQGCMETPAQPRTDIKGVRGKSSLLHFDNVGASDNFKWEYQQHVDNKRVFYGEYSKYGLASVCSGNNAEFNPEDIWTADAQASPRVFLKVDPRPTGRPYFHFAKYKGTDVTLDYANAVAGMEWQSSPITYTGKSGTTLEQIKLNTARANERRNAGWSLAEQSIGIGSNLANKNLTGVTAGIFGMAKAIDHYANTQSQQIQEFGLNNYVVAPEINFPRSETIRDLLGNHVVAYRYRPTSNDIVKFDKILRMYGYRHTAQIPTAETEFNNTLWSRPVYNYIKMSGCHIAGDAPRWLRELAEAQLNAGVRVWMTKLPDPVEYEQGHNV